VSEAVAEREPLEERDHDCLLLDGQRGEARRGTIGGTERGGQRFHRHPPVAPRGEGKGEESRGEVAPRPRGEGAGRPESGGVEVAEPPEREALEVRVGRLIARRVERLGLVVAVDGTAAAEAQRRRYVRVGTKHVEGLAHDLIGRDGGLSRFGIVSLGYRIAALPPAPAST